MSDLDSRDLDPGQRRVQQALREMAPVRPDPAFRRRLREEFVSGTITSPVRGAPRGARGHRRWWWAALPAAAVVLLSLLVADRGPSWRLHDVSGEGEVVVDGRSIPALARGELERTVGAGSTVATPGDASLVLASPGVLLLEVAGHSEVVLPHDPHRLFRETLTCRVAAGELRLRTGPRFSGQRLVVLTAEGRTEVTGTTVSVYRGEGFTCVCVLEGTARIGRDEAALEAIPPGMRKVMFADGRPPLVTEIEPTHGAGLERFQRIPW